MGTGKEMCISLQNFSSSLAGSHLAVSLAGKLWKQQLCPLLMLQQHRGRSRLCRPALGHPAAGYVPPRRGSTPQLSLQGASCSPAKVHGLNSAAQLGTAGIHKAPREVWYI